MSAPVVVFSSRQTSHPFQERHISLHEPAKIGRSVARVHPAPSNAIFDCKVLSRNHALMWFEDSKFFLQDTKSSNGTFVNNQRLSKGSEESDPHEVFSGDIIQFGVDVMENSKRVTHGCIMATVTLYLPDGTEAKPRYSSQNQSSLHGATTTVHSQELYQLAQYLQEALHREQILEEKLNQMQRLLSSATEACESSWQAQINEERLISKLEVLQSQLTVCSKNVAENSLQQQIITMEEERLSYETGTKEALRKVLEEKLNALQDLADAELALSNTEKELKHTRTVTVQTEQELANLSEKYESQLIEIQELRQKVEDIDSLHHADCTRLESEIQNLRAQLDDAVLEKENLLAKLVRLNSCKETSEPKVKAEPSEETQLNGTHSPSIDDGSPDSPDCKPTGINQAVHLEELAATHHKLLLAEEQIDMYIGQLHENEQLLDEKTAETEKLHSQLDQSQLQIVEYVTKLATLEDKLKCSTETNTILEHSAAELKDRLNSIMNSSEASISELKAKLSSASTLSDGFRMQLGDIQDALAVEKKLRQHVQDYSTTLQADLDQTKLTLETQSLIAKEFQDKSIFIEKTSEDLRKEYQEKVAAAERMNEELRKQAIQKQKDFVDLKDECTKLRNHVHTIEADLLRLQSDNKRLIDEVSSCKGHNKQLLEECAHLTSSCEELMVLKDTLCSRECDLMTNMTDAQKESAMLKEQLERESTERLELTNKYQVSSAELDSLRLRLVETVEKHSITQTELAQAQKTIKDMSAEYNQIVDRSKILSLCSAMPLLVLMLAVIMALYPFLSRQSAPSQGPGS